MLYVLSLTDLYQLNFNYNISASTHLSWVIHIYTDYTTTDAVHSSLHCTDVCLEVLTSWLIALWTGAIGLYLTLRPLVFTPCGNPGHCHLTTMGWARMLLLSESLTPPTQQYNYPDEIPVNYNNSECPQVKGPLHHTVASPGLYIWLRRC